MTLLWLKKAYLYIIVNVHTHYSKSNTRVGVSWARTRSCKAPRVRGWLHIFIFRKVDIYCFLLYISRHGIVFLTLHEARAVERSLINPRYSVDVAWHGLCDSLAIACSLQCDVLLMAYGSYVTSRTSTSDMHCNVTLTFTCGTIFGLVQCNRYSVKLH